MTEIQAPFVLFDDPRTTNGTRLYSAPLRILTCTDPSEVETVLADMDQAINDGFHVAGYLAYELGYLFEDKLAPLMPDTKGQPLIWMGVFKPPAVLDQADTANLMERWAADTHTIGPLSPTITHDHYIDTVETIQDHIRAGDVYQINYTFSQTFSFSGSPLALYANLRQKQRASYGGVIATENHHILSLSPELFVNIKDNTVQTRPMKGTAARVPDPKGDEQRRQWLCHDEKSKAENLMIVDLLRNDLGRIAKTGTVKVTDLFHVETYPTLHQMTSSIKAQLKPQTSFGAVIRALFPCGSITGAPKVKAMEIIRDLEPEPRHVYTGAIGYASAKDGARFNVAIRTLKITPNGRGEMGIGSGIVYDSDAEQEWQECHLKAHFVTNPTSPSFQLLETLKWTAEDGFSLLDRHLDRLKHSAAYFCFPYDQAEIIAALETCVPDDNNTQGARRIRLTLDENGKIETQAPPLLAVSSQDVLSFAISDKVVDITSPFTFHKTTQRAFFDDERNRHSTDEVVFLNKQGHITEGSFTNIFIEKDGGLLTPPVSSGLLAGTLRQDLLDSKRTTTAILTLKDLGSADKIFLGNSVRGLMSAKLTRVMVDTAKP